MEKLEIQVGKHHVKIIYAEGKTLEECLQPYFRRKNEWQDENQKVKKRS